jgi:hypothetical protein
VRQPSLSLCFFACALLAACAVPVADGELGQLSIPLRATGSQGKQFQLEGKLAVTLESGETRNIVLNGTTSALVTALPAGIHQFELRDFVVRHLTDGVATPVAVLLTSENPQFVEIVAGRTTALTLQFAARSGDLTFGDGQVAVDFEVDEAGLCTDDGRLVDALTLSKVTIDQAVQIDLAVGGAPVTTRNAPLVRGRPATLRVHVTPTTGFSPHSLRARLVLSDGVDAIALEKRLTPHATSSDADLTSTFNFTLDAAQIDQFGSYRVELLEDDCTVNPGVAARARFPASGFAQLGAENVGVLNVALVPIRYAVDGSNRVPNVDAAAVQRMRSELLRAFPVSDVHVEVLPVITFSTPPQPGTLIFTQMLDQVNTLRNQNTNARNKYFVGLVQPTATFEQFCSTGICTLGAGFQNSVPNSSFRSAVAVGYMDNLQTYAAVLRHLGQAHGRRNSPGCSGSSPDPQYPYAEGAIGHVGIDVTTGVLHAATDKDMMSVCVPPRWISDFTYKALADRVRVEQ